MTGRGPTIADVENILKFLALLVLARLGFLFPVRMPLLLMLHIQILFPSSQDKQQGKLWEHVLVFFCDGELGRAVIC